MNHRTARFWGGLDLLVTAMAGLAYSGQDFWTEDVLGSTLFMEDKAFLMLAPRPAMSHVSNFSWSPSGNYLLFTQNKPITRKDAQSPLSPVGEETEQRQGTWGVETGHVLATGYEDPQKRQAFSWIPGQDVAFREVLGPENTNGARPVQIQWIMPKEKSLPSVAIPDRFHNPDSSYLGNQTAELAFHPTRPKILLSIDQVNAKRVGVDIGDRTIRATPVDLFIVTPIGIEARFTSSNPFLQYIWSSDGSTLYAIHHKRRAANQKVEDLVYRFDPVSSRLVPADARPESLYYGRAHKPPALEAMLSQAPGGDGRFRALLGQALPPGTRVERQIGAMAEIAAQAEGVEVSPPERHVAFTSNGLLQVREIVPVDPNLLKRAKQENDRRQAMLQAKQNALAQLIYAADYDDNFMSNTGDWQSRVLPYLKNASLLTNFVLTFEGGNAADVANVAETEMGYVETPSGRAVAYLDGHVVWFPHTGQASLEQRSVTGFSALSNVANDQQEICVPFFGGKMSQNQLLPP